MGQRTWVVGVSLALLTVLLLGLPVARAPRFKESLRCTPENALAVAVAAELGRVPSGKAITRGELLRAPDPGDRPCLSSKLHYSALMIRRVLIQKQSDSRIIDCWPSDGGHSSFKFHKSEIDAAISRKELSEYRRSTDG